MSGKASESGVRNVDCCVRDCRYHSSTDQCSARQITVENPEAHRKGETFCATFENKAAL